MYIKLELDWEYRESFSMEYGRMDLEIIEYSQSISIQILMIEIVVVTCHYHCCACECKTTLERKYIWHWMKIRYSKGHANYEHSTVKICSCHKRF